MSEPASSSAAHPPTLSGVVPILRVENLEVSVSYYLDKLGFESQWRAGQMASVGRGKTSIMLNENDQGQPGTWLWIGVSDVDALYAEFQKRGAIHFHAVIRIDGPAGPSTLPPYWASTELLERSIRSAVAHCYTAVRVPPADGQPARILRWGTQLDVRPIKAFGTHSQISPRKIS